MATNKKITELTELSEADLSDDDVLAIVDISAGTTNKVRKSTLASALSGVSSITATSPIAVNQSTGAVVVSTGTIPIAKGGTGETSAPAALAALGGISDPTTTRGDIITKGASALNRLPIGAANTFLKSDGTDPTWASITSLDAGLVISGSTASDALRITQTGAGNALVVEDSANPDSSPFVVDASGNVGIGTSSVSGSTKLEVYENSAAAHVGIRANNAAADGYATLWLSNAGDNTGIIRGGASAAAFANQLTMLTNTAIPITFNPNNTEAMRIESGGNLKMAATQGPALMNEDASNTNPTLIPRKTDTGTGWGSNGTNNLEGIVGSVRSVLFGSVVTTFHSTAGTEVARIDRSSGNVGIGTIGSPAKQLHITKAAIADIGTLTDGATITPDFDANQNFSVTLGGNRTLANPTNIDAGQTGSIFVVQDGTGSRTLSFGSYWDFAGGTAPTLSTAAGAVDRIDYIVRTGTSIHAVATLNLS
jgi:hypothetical protein